LSWLVFVFRSHFFGIQIRHVNPKSEAHREENHWRAACHGRTHGISQRCSVCHSLGILRAEVDRYASRHSRMLIHHDFAYF
jgi:hypothetical protein